ncbi:hypothetical protein ACWEQG_01535 [Microbispora sp. NPDC004025]
MITTRTQDDILTRARTIQNDDFFGFRTEVLVGALEYEHARGFLKPETTAEEWGPAPDDEAILAQARDYYQFALDKIRDHRGISASRSVAKLTEFAWLLGKDDVVTAMDQADYAQYGAPKIKAFATGLGLAWPPDEDMTRMAAGEPCTPDCAEGCGR